MATDLGNRHLVEINHPSILEPIDEVFDGITSLLTGNALMYGSTVTAILAGLPIVGDLDIAVSAMEHSRLAQRIASSVKWLQIDGQKIPESRHENRWSMPGVLPSTPTKHKDSYKGDKHLPISSVIVFKTVNDARIQIMQARKTSGDPLEDALDIVRKVDFAFCGMAIDKWGRLLETIPHAYNDCLDQNIRIVNYRAELDLSKLVCRIRKYTKRGWNLTFSIDQARQNIERAKIASLNASKKKKKRKPRMPGIFRIKLNSSKGATIELRRSVIDLVGVTRCDEVVRHFARDRGVILESIITRFGGMSFYTHSGVLSAVLAREIVKEATIHFKNDYNITPEILRYKGKKIQTKQAYNTYYGGSFEQKPKKLEASTEQTLYEPYSNS